MRRPGAALAIACALSGSLAARRAFASLPTGESAPAFDAQRTDAMAVDAPAPGAMADAAIAEGHARAFLATHLASIAPGSSDSDFVLASDDLDAGLRTVAFVQERAGAPVFGGQVSFVYQTDRLALVLSRAVPFDPAAPEPPPIGADSDTVLLPLRARGALGYRWAKRREHRLPASAFGPPSDLEVFTDAATGEPLATRELLRFSMAALTLHVPARSPSYGARIDAPAELADLTVDGSPTLSSSAGTFPFAGATAQVSAWSSGPEVDVASPGIPGAATTFVVADGAAHSWDASTDELADAELSAFVHAGEVRAYAKSFAPTLAFLGDPAHVRVNEAGTCNSYSDGTFVHFFRASGACENTARIADIVYHEYGHSIHAHAIIPGAGAFEGALSEGVSDYLAATMTGDPGVGRGIHYDATPARDLDPPDYENRWPDDLTGEIHHDGLIIGQALWDLRKELMQKLGPVAGRARADTLYYQGIRRAPDLPSMYPVILVADDDDGNLSNGTPNICEINRAFGLHGLRGVSATTTPPALVGEAADGYPVEARISGLFHGCADDAIASAILSYRVEGGTAPPEALPMTVDGAIIRATIPRAPPRTTLEYQVVVTLAGGVTFALPDNAADPWYQLRVGPVEDLYCTDFERDPTLGGWAHGASPPSADDWDWGAPAPTPFNGDPTAPFSGFSVFGNDLGDAPGHDGKYQANMTNWAETPSIDTTGFAQVRLEVRRWLTVEDASVDQASIYANGSLAWRNRASGSGASPRTDHRDREWRFQDVDLTPFIADHTVKLRFELASHGARQLGGWTLDDLCVVGVPRPKPTPPPPGEIEPRGGVSCSAAPAANSPAHWAAIFTALALAARRRSLKGRGRSSSAAQRRRPGSRARS